MVTNTSVRLRLDGQDSEFNGVGVGYWGNTLVWRVASFGLSLALHGILMASLLYLPAAFIRPEPPVRVRVYKVLDLKKEPLFYWAPDPSTLPSISSPAPIGDSQAFRGIQHSPTEKIVVNQSTPEPAKHMVWQPDKPDRLRIDTALPNLVTVQREATPTPLAAPPVLAEGTTTQQRASSPVIPESAIIQLPTVKPKPKILRWSNNTIRSADSIKDAPPELALPQSAMRTEMGTAALGSMPKRPPVYRPGRNLDQGARAGARTEALPTLDEVPVLTTTNTGGAVTAALIGLNPAQVLTKLPDGSRGAAFSRADRVGEPSAPKSGVGPAIPGVAIAGTASLPTGPSAAPGAAATRSPVSGNELRMSLSGSGMSAPLRPAARSLPRAIEARFRDRVVYTLVIPKPNQLQYIADWTIWFAERTPETFAASSMKAPAPLRKSIDESDTAKKSIAAEGWVQLSGVIGTDGKISSVVPLHGRYPVVAAHAAEDLAKWEFRPALRNGVAVEVEVVIEIPFQIR
jgi:hypothetical protein